MIEPSPAGLLNVLSSLAEHRSERAERADPFWYENVRSFGVDHRHGRAAFGSGDHDSVAHEEQDLFVVHQLVIQEGGSANRALRSARIFGRAEAVAS